MLCAPLLTQAPTPGGWTFTLDSGFAVQPKADLNGGTGACELHRSFYSAGVD